MNLHKGFSLIEVLVSLLLVSTVALSLLKQQWQSRQLLDHLILREQGTYILDQINESLLAGKSKPPALPSPYHLVINHKNRETLIHLDWYKQTGTLTRKLTRI